MTYLLDTNVVSLLMREDVAAQSWLASIAPDDRLAICTIVRGEILFGLARLAEGRRRHDLEAKAQRLFAALRCEPIPAASGDAYARIKLAQQRRGLLLDENDLWIAATAVAIDATLVTRDNDFMRIEGLEVVRA